jgi:hypothetical protein
MAKKQYIGESEVVATNPTLVATPLGSPIFEVELAGGKKINLTKRMLDASLTDKPTDLTQLRDRRGSRFVGEVVALLQEWGVSDDDYTPWMQWVGRTVDIIRDNALSQGIGVESPGDWSMVNYQLVLKENNTGEETNTGADGAATAS